MRERLRKGLWECGALLRCLGGGGGVHRERRGERRRRVHAAATHPC